MADHPTRREPPSVLLAEHEPEVAEMSARFDRPGQRPGQRQGPQAADSASIWESLSRDLDPTVEEDQVGGGPPRPA